MLSTKQLLHHSDERIVYFLQHHWVVYALPGLAALVLSVTPFVAMSIFYNRIPTGDLAEGLFVVGLSIYYLSIWLFLFTIFLQHYLDVWIVTTHRIMYIEQHSLFSRTVSEQPLSRVQDVTAEVKGVFPTLMGYGTISVQTAGAVGKFEFKEVANPTKISQSIFQLCEEAHKRVGRAP